MSLESAANFMSYATIGLSGASAIVYAKLTQLRVDRQLENFTQQLYQETQDNLRTARKTGELIRDDLGKIIGYKSDWLPMDSDEVSKEYEILTGNVARQMPIQQALEDISMSYHRWDSLRSKQRIEKSKEISEAFDALRA